MDSCSCYVGWTGFRYVKEIDKCRDATLEIKLICLFWGFRKGAHMLGPTFRRFIGYILQSISRGSLFNFVCGLFWSFILHSQICSSSTIKLNQAITVLSLTKGLTGSWISAAVKYYMFSEKLWFKLWMKISWKAGRLI